MFPSVYRENVPRLCEKTRGKETCNKYYGFPQNTSDSMTHQKKVLHPALTFVIRAQRIVESPAVRVHVRSHERSDGRVLMRGNNWQLTYKKKIL